MAIKLISSDLNGTLVHQHTMSDMVRIYIGQEQFVRASHAFQRQTSGEATIEEAFSVAGPLTRGLTLRQAIEYTRKHMTYIRGFAEFVNSLRNQRKPLVINSTGYSITIYAIREHVGRDNIHGQIGNRLIFGVDADAAQALRDDELERYVTDYFGDTLSLVYDRIKATGDIDLEIQDEAAKASLIRRYCATHLLDIKPSELMHMGDTMGDSKGILEVARQGGIGIAFNYNDALERFLRAKIASENISGKICFVNKKGVNPDLRDILGLVK